MTGRRSGPAGRWVVPSERRLDEPENPRATLSKFFREYRSPKPPIAISQEALDFDTGHYGRLLSLDGEMPDARDVYLYTQDLAYVPDLQPDLFACLLPVCLQAWQHDLKLRHDSDYGGFVEHFSLALARRPLADDLLTPKRAAAVKAFMRDSLLDRIDLESSLSQSGQYCTAHGWIHTLGSYCVFFPELEALWSQWWRFDTPGQCVAALQYISCFMYDRDDNPIFAPPTPEQGGGPPCLWESDGHIYVQCWHPENVRFFRDTVTVDYVRQALGRAARALEGVVESDVPRQMCDDFPYLDDVLSHRLAVFPQIVSRPLDETGPVWPPPPAT